MSASRHGGRTPNESTPMSIGLETWHDPEQVTMQWREEICSYLSRIRIPRSSIRQCIHYTNLATQAPLQHTYNTTDCFVGNTAHFRLEDVQ